MEEKNNFTELELQEQIKMQENLIKLMRVIDECIENMDKIYCLAKTKEMLNLSNNN